MKNQQFTILVITGLMIAFFHTVEAQWGVKGNGKVVKEERKIEAFTAISVEDGIDVYLKKGNSTALVVEADENIQDLIETDVSNNRLRIYLSKKGYAKTMDIYLTTGDLEAISSSGGSDVIGEGVFGGNQLKLSSSGGSDMSLEVNVAELIINTSGGSDLTLEGSATDAKISCSGGSDLEAEQLTIQNAKVENSGGSDADLKVIGELVVQASGASDINLYGKPAKLTKMMSGSSDLNIASN